jgi:hypothetical protein
MGSDTFEGSADEWQNAMVVCGGNKKVPIEVRLDERLEPTLGRGVYGKARG